MDPSSLHVQKSSFLTTQIRLLTSPLYPTSQFTTALSKTSTPLTTKTVDDLITKVNEKIKSHNKLVFSAQSQRHIIEQIETLYFSEALADDLQNDDEGEELVAIERDTDLTDTSTLQSLPDELQQSMLRDVSDFSIDEEQAEQYTRLRAEVIELAEQRDIAREKLLRYEKLGELLGPFENAQESVQPNLITKDGEMSRELERMRVLLARVTGRLGQSDGLPRNAVGEQDRSATFEEKLMRVMELDTS